MCATCDFDLGGHVHLCPVCASAPRSALSPRRKKLLIWSFVLAIWSTIGMTCLFAGVFAGAAQSKQATQMLGLVLIGFVLFPSAMGFALGLTAKDRRMTNPPSIWIATVWNAILMGSFLLLTIIGNARK
jgi:hypothetical protein